MATIKKNQMANIIFPMVDGVDFASIESGLTASDFESKITKKFFGVTHGNSTAFTSGTISKAATLVRSGIFQQTLKAAETNYDYLMVSFAPANTSLAHQVLVFHPVDYDDSDIFSQLSDIGSNLLSYLTGISDMLSNVDSQLLLNASMISDVDSQLLLNASMISDVQSALDSQFLIVASNISDVDSQLLLNASVISDIQSALDSQFTYMSNVVSDMHSDLRSQISGITTTVSASDMSDIASRVWSEKFNVYSAVASSFGSMVTQQLQGASNMLSNISALVSDVDSQLLLNASMISDAYSLLSDHHSDFQSRVNKQVANFSQLSNVHSDLRSQISGLTVNITASDMSDIASRVWATAEGTRVDSRILIIQSLVSDVDSQLLLNASMISDVQSALDSQFTYMSNAVSDMHSDLRSQISGITVTVSASDMSDIASRVWATAEGTRVDSRILVIQSLVSDVDSQLLLNASVISDVYSLLSDHHSDFQSRVTKQVANFSQLSDIGSDLRSYLTGISGALSDVESQLDLVPIVVSTSDISNIASAVWAAKYTGHSLPSSFGSLFSDVYSRIVLAQSNVSDVQSALDSQFIYTSAILSDIQSDLRSQISGITVSVTPSDMSDIASRVWATAEGVRVDSRILVLQSNVSDIESQLDLNASVISDTYSLLSDHHSDFQSRVTKLVATNSQVSDLMSDLRSYLVGISGAISDVESQVDLLATSNYLSQVHSDIVSTIGNVSVTLTASDISDIASAVADAVTTVTPSDISDIASAVWANVIGTRVDSRILVLQSNVSDVYSLLSDHVSDFQSRVTKLVASSSQLSDIGSDLRSYLVGMSGAISDIESQVDLLATSNYLSQVHSDIVSQVAGITASVSASDMSDIASRVWATAEGIRVDSRILVIQSLASDIDSQLLLNASVISDIQSALDSQFIWTSDFLSDMNSDLSSQIAGINATLSISDISDIASAVWANTIGTRVDSRIRLIQSNISDVESQLDLTASVVSDVYSLLSDHHSDFQSRVNKQVANNSQLSNLHSDLRSYLVGLSGMVSDVDSQVDLLATSNYLSQVHSDIQSRIGNVTIAPSDMSDIASRVWATTEGLRVDSRLALVQSNVSDIESQLDLTASAVSDIYSLMSDHHSDFQSRVDKRVANFSQLSDIYSDLTSYLIGLSGLLSDVDSQLLLNASVISDIQSLLDDPRTEPGQGAPPVNPDAMTKIDYIYKSWRNKKDNDGSENKLYADDGTTVDQKQTTTEAAGTVTKGEWGTGP